MALCSLAVPFAPCSAYATQHELAHSLRLSKTSHIFVHANLLATALQASEEVRIPRSRVYILEGNASPGFITFKDLVKLGEEENLVPITTRPVTKDQLAFLLFSSGTTGLSKGMLRIIFQTIYTNSVISCRHFSC